MRLGSLALVLLPGLLLPQVRPHSSNDHHHAHDPHGVARFVVLLCGLRLRQLVDLCYVIRRG